MKSRESFPGNDSQSSEKENEQKAFEGLFENTLQKKGENIPTIEYNLPYPKEDFLRFIVAEKNVLLHGSSNREITILEPRQANDGSKKSGNKNAVYGVTDPVLPIFYAIQDRERLQGTIESVENDEETGESDYKFWIPKEMIDIKPWTRGFIYIFDKSQFKPEQGDTGEPSGEWTSEQPVNPIARLEVGPEDFRYLDKVEGK